MSYRLTLHPWAIFLTVLLGLGVHAAERGLANPFFAFDNGIGGIPEPEKVLKELGYDGLGSRGYKLLPQIKTYEAAGLKIFATYVRCDLDKTPSIDPALKDAVQELKGTDMIFWLTVAGKKRGQDDDKAVAVIREFADQVAVGGLRVAIYPHAGDYTSVAADALRFIKRIDRKNVGISINLCHELRGGQGPELSKTIREALPYLMLVSVNGAEPLMPGYGWEQLIQPLGKGSYDVLGFLRELKTVGYRGPIGLQCYNVKGDKVENLKQSIRAWKEYSASLAAEAGGK
ncbi:MAG: TIM barrel protein [Verrucomicrobiota bacterium]